MFKFNNQSTKTSDGKYAVFLVYFLLTFYLMNTCIRTDCNDSVFFYLKRVSQLVFTQICFPSNALVIDVAVIRKFFLF